MGEGGTAEGGLSCVDEDEDETISSSSSSEISSSEMFALLLSVSMEEVWGSLLLRFLEDGDLEEIFADIFKSTSRLVKRGRMMRKSGAELG